MLTCEETMQWGVGLKPISHSKQRLQSGDKEFINVPDQGTPPSEDIYWEQCGREKNIKSVQVLVHSGQAKN